MRHVYIRGIMSLIWLAASVISGLSGKTEMTVLYVVLGAAFLYAAYTEWKKEKDRKGDR